jgi:enediyne biosynthesis protein E4
MLQDALRSVPMLVLLMTLGGAAGCGDSAETCTAPWASGVPAGGACTLDTDCAGAGDAEGVCVAGICGVVAVGGVCDGDGSRGECPSGFRCREMVVETGTYGVCLPTCDCSECDGLCEDEISCLPAPEMNCDPRGCTVWRGPALVCKTPEPLGEGPYYSNITVAAGMDASALDVLGNRMAIVDINADGYPDVFLHRMSNVRDDHTLDATAWSKRVLLNTGDPGGTVFQEWTLESGYTSTREEGITGRVAHFAVFGDVNNDGHVDLFSGTHLQDDVAEDPGDRSEVMLGNGDGTFALAEPSDTTAAESTRRAPTSAAFLDYNLDGNLDLFVGYDYGIYGALSLAQQDRLFRGDGDGQFSDVTHVAGLTTVAGAYSTDQHHRPTWGVTVCDVDSDGAPDLITSSYGRQPNMLWRNVNGVSFENIAGAVGASMDAELDFGDNVFFRCHCLDVPTDPACAANPGPAPWGCPAADYWNSGTDDQLYRLGGNTFTTVCGDIDNDGDMDLYNAEIRHSWAGSSSDPSQLLLHDGADVAWRFERPGNVSKGLDREWTSLDWNEGDVTASFFDFNNDGLLDIFLGSSDYPGNADSLFQQYQTHNFADISETSGVNHYFGNSHGVLDFDRDGDLDLIIGSSTMRCSASDTPPCPWRRPEVHLYRNEVGQSANWMAIRLVGAGAGFSNVSGVGARIIVTVGSTSQIREVQGGYGHYGLQMPFTQYFGLGSTCVADAVEIHWPNIDFAVTRLPWVPANYYITVYEVDGSVVYEPVTAP